MKRKYRDDRGFLSLKTGLMTAGAFLATASMGTAILVGLPAAQSTNVFTDDKSGFCVTATLENDDSYFAQRGNCGNEGTPEPDPLPEVPEPTPEPTPEPIPEPTPTPEPEPVLPPGPPPIIIDTPQIMVTTWDTSLASNCHSITLPISGSVDTQIQWTQGSSPEKVNINNPIHDFAVPYGLTEVTINGTFENWGGGNWADANCLVSVDRWEGTETKNLTHAFIAANNLKHVEAIPSTTTILSYAFSKITSNFTLGDLKTSNVTTMKNMFDSSPNFNQPLNFDTSNVKDMNSMFQSATRFNSSLNFNTINVTDMGYMFIQASAFNQPVNFDTPNVKDMNSMFHSASSFNQSLNFDTSSVTNMAQMLALATAFNQPVNFNTSNVTDMKFMFYSTNNFNQPLNFKTSNVTDMTSMFLNARLFNQDLSHWDVSKVVKRNSFSTGTNWKLPKPNFK